MATETEAEQKIKSWVCSKRMFQCHNVVTEESSWLKAGGFKKYRCGHLNRDAAQEVPEMGTWTNGT